MDTNTTFGLPPTVEDLQVEIAALRAKLAAKDAPPIQDLDTQGLPKKYVKLEVYRGSQAQDPEFVKPSVNGYMVKIQRGEKVITHACFAEVLDHAVEEITVQSEGELITRPNHRFPFQVLGEATEEEYLAFKQKMKDMGTRAVMQG